MATSGEFVLIEKIRELLGPPSSRVAIGVGDDAAVVSLSRNKCLATVDMMVEGVHFDLSYTLPEELGHKAIAINFSDVAAMAGQPRYALVSLGLPSSVDDSFVEAFYTGMRRLAVRFGTDIVGGNLTRAPSLVIDVTLLGEPAGSLCLRGGAKPGDLLAVTGPLGASAAGLACLRRWGRAAMNEYQELVVSHLMPFPRVTEAQVLNSTGLVTAMIDISDGLSSELHHLAKASGVGIRIDEASIPVTPATRKAGSVLGDDPMAWALGGGEDYELLFAFKPSRSISLPVPITVIGEVMGPSMGVVFRREDGREEPLPARGWDHFASRGE